MRLPKGSARFCRGIQNSGPLFFSLRSCVRGAGFLSISRIPLSANLNREFGAVLDRQRDGEKSVCGIADEFEKIRFGVVVHDVAAGAKLGSHELDDLTGK